MERREWRIVERPHGVGNLKKGKGAIAGVIYSIIVKKEIIIIDNFGSDRQEIDGMGRIEGNLRFIDKSIKVGIEEIFTLELSDGREFDISIDMTNPLVTDYKFIIRDAKGFKVK